MPKTKSKKPRVVVEEIEDVLPPLPAEPVAVVSRGDTGMILDMEGYGAEVASALMVNGLRAYLSVVNKGVNLVATDRRHKAFVPVKIAACAAGLDIKKDEAEKLTGCGGVLAFLVDDGEEHYNYYIPVAEYLERAADRGESGLRLDLDKHAEWLNGYEGHAGIRTVFKHLLP